MASDERPTDEQKAFLDHVIARCNIEQKELGQTRAHVAESKTNYSEPVRTCLFGIPGAGKSHCIKLLRKLFEDCLHWEDGVQFQFLAQQNTMASLIGGKTVNTWGVIPINPEAAERRRLSAKEDAFLRRACQRHPHARANGRRRPFGGINIVFAGDLWQLPPVRASALFSNPYRKGFSVGEQKIFKMFWQQKDDSILKTFELTQSKRTKDEWLKAVLRADRLGAETWEMYCFIHGLPTRNPGSWNPSTDQVDCGNARCQTLAAEWETLYLGSAKVAWEVRVSLECATCQKERKRRCCVISTDEQNQARFREKPFTEAPYVHPFRYPSGHARQLRAIEFAKSHKRQLLWTTAYDKPQAKNDSKDQGERAEQRKEDWLQLPSARTSGIPGLLPLVQDLPIQFTETPDKASREKGVFKNARGWLRGWELEPEEAERIKKMPQEPEIVLKRRPRKLFIEMQSASKDLPLVNEKRIYTLLAKPKEWSLDGQGNVKITRYGFSIVPDFGGTAHFYCGTSLDACIGDLLPWWRKPQMDDQLRGYIIKSRVRDASKLLTTQPYSPHLFRQGILPGPNLLHETLMKRMTPEEAKASWRAREIEPG